MLVLPEGRRGPLDGRVTRLNVVPVTVPAIDLACPRHHGAPGDRRPPFACSRESISVVLGPYSLTKPILTVAEQN
jgi:hypothetical protein